MRRIRIHGRRVRAHYILDFYAGTCTSAALYALRTHKHARVVCIDRDHSLEWVRKHVPAKYLSRLLYIQEDVRALSKQELMRRIKERWPTAEWSKFSHIHASPSCRTHSRADRGFSRHRDRHGRPLSKLAKDDDKALRHTLRVIMSIKEEAPNALYTIEQPVLPTFKLVPAIAKLRRTTGWH